MPAMSISEIGWPARSEMTGMGAVMTSMIGCSGPVTSAILSTNGFKKSLMNDPMLISTSRKPSVFRLLPKSKAPTSVRLPVSQSSTKRALTSGKSALTASGMMSGLNFATRSRLTSASAESDTFAVRLPSSEKDRRVSSVSALFSRFTPNCAVMKVLRGGVPGPLCSSFESTVFDSLISSCRKPSEPVIDEV